VPPMQALDARSAESLGQAGDPRSQPVQSPFGFATLPVRGYSPAAFSFVTSRSQGVSLVSVRCGTVATDYWRVIQGLNCSSFSSRLATTSASRRPENLPTRTRKSTGADADGSVTYAS
jgi:hypothetical protein